ncbi:MAG: alanine racemase [Actinobacteria bacterium]|nr:alanine racemase [Actinomycetota bacterium]
MTRYPRLTIDLDVVAANTRLLAARLHGAGFTLVGVTKCVDGEPRVGQALLEAGCAGLADSRLPSLARLATASLEPLTLIRAPQPDELAAVAQVADRVLLSDVGAARGLGEHAAGSPVEVLLTVDLGDRREGVLPDAAPAAARALAGLPGVILAGISVNFACLSGQLPTQNLFRQAEAVMAEVADVCAVEPVLSLGGTCVLQHLAGYRPRFRTEIRSGGGPLYGYDFVSGAGLEGMRRTDPVLTAVVLECYRKPPAPSGATGCDAFGHAPEITLPDGDANYALLHLGRRDCEPGGLRPLLPGSYLAGATSDVSVLITPEPLHPGDHVSFAVDYDALVRAVTSPFVMKELISGETPEVSKGDS